MERHGIYTKQVPTSVLSTITASAVPVVFGTAPVNLTKRSTVPVNEPILCYSYNEAVEAFGYSDDWDRFTLCEFIYSQFKLFGQAPVVFINVMDPANHKTIVVPVSIPLVDGDAVIEMEGVLLDSISVKSVEGSTTYDKEVDYTLSFNKQGFVVVTRTKESTIPAQAAELKIGYVKLDRTTVTKSELIGGIDGATGKRTGLELIQQIFPRFGMVPGLILAPGFSHDPEVAAVMNTKAININNHFRAMAVVDIPTDTVNQYTLAPEWKKNNGYTADSQIVCYPKIRLAERIFHISTQVAGVICQIDQQNGGVPYASPSNQPLKANGALLAEGSDLFLGPEEANYLNANGIVTALNFIGGWKVFGNRTGAYPAISDPVEAFIPVRRMFDWLSNTIILTYWQKLDNPANKRLIETITDSINIWLNGLQSSGYLLGGRVEFRSDENLSTDLMDGKLRFHIFATPPSPAQEIEFLLEYDAQYLADLTA